MAQVLMFLKIIQDGIIPFKETISTTNFLYRFHTKFTSTALILTSSLLFIQQFFIDHLKCFRPEILVESAVLNQFCFASSETFAKNYAGSKISHHYFQFVPYILLLQGIIFHLPQILWSKYFENGRLESIVTLKLPSEPPKGEEEAKGKADAEAVLGVLEVGKTLSKVEVDSLKSPKDNTIYAVAFMVCEFLNFIIVLSSLLFTDWLLHGHFKSMGIDWSVYVDKLKDYEIEVEAINNPEKVGEANVTLSGLVIENPLELAFPTSFTCKWVKYDPIVGNPESKTLYHINCILGMNASHQRIYLVFWFWLLMLLIFGGANFLRRLILVSSSRMRTYVLCRTVKKQGIKNCVLVKTTFGDYSYRDWFFIKRLFGHVDSKKIEWISAQIASSDDLGSNEKLLLKSNDPETKPDPDEEDSINKDKGLGDHEMAPMAPIHVV